MTSLLCVDCGIELNYDNCSCYERYLENDELNKNINSHFKEDNYCDECYDKKYKDKPTKPKFIMTEFTFPNNLMELLMNGVPPNNSSTSDPIIIDLSDKTNNNQNNDEDEQNISSKRQNKRKPEPIDPFNEVMDIEEERKKIKLAQEKIIASYPYEWLGDDIKNIDDLIKLGLKYELKEYKKKRFNLNLKRLNKLVDPLIELRNMIGLIKLKDNIFNQIIYYLQDLEDKNTDMLHTVIQGPPGVGKTHICKILAKIYKGLGFLKREKITTVKRDDLIGKYLGQTADKTRKLLDKALGGVLFIDEAYSLGDNEGRDSYSKEAIDMITSYLSEHPHDLICIIAGYKDALNKRFFSQNEGLSRRFAHRFDIEKYSGPELRLILFKIIEDAKWEVNDKNQIPEDYFNQYIDLFLYNGGDMLTLFGFCKKAHSKRLLKIQDEMELKKSKKKITFQDLKDAVELFLKNPEYAERIKNDDSLTGLSMYM